MDFVSISIVSLALHLLVIILIFAILLICFRNVKHKKMIIVVSFTYLCLGVTIYVMYHKINILNTQLMNAINNEKAYAAENYNLREKNLVYRMSIEQMEYFQDSLRLRIDELINEKKIKEN